MFVETKVSVEQDDVLKQIESLRVLKDTTVRLNLINKTLEFTYYEWNRILDLAIKGFEQE